MNTSVKKGTGKWRQLCLLLAITLLTAYTYGQVRITGKVTSTTGASVESVAVTVKGTKFGGLADNNGNYSFTAPFSTSTLSMSLGLISTKRLWPILPTKLPPS